ncbi:MAG: phage holin family protein [Ruminococcus sp.]|nr:phage holin family protein [Ruminococcus sp.]
MKDFFHIIVAGAIGALAAYFNVLLIPLAILLAVMLIDYITGMAGASYSGKLSSRVGIMGILKKAGYFALVAVGMVADYLISSALVEIGIDLKITYCFGMIITIWLIINELISILENLGELNVPLPSFLVNIIKTLKSKVEEQAEGKQINVEKDKHNE